ncbi:enoyl-CoA hydratase [Ottowia sp.]|uniref:enoyl-CoA hydratase n=1 Tax=Ottowia sp. TaxID=1898956 RepID=UPI003A840960
MTQEILEHQDGAVLTLTFNRLARKNSINTAMYEALAAAVKRSATDDSVRVLVMQGHETVFSAGNDIEDFLRMQKTEASNGSQGEAAVFRFLRDLAAYPKPVVAAVCGPAVGIGTTLLMHCDLIYAGDNAAFSMPFVNLGLCPEAASSLLVPRLFGYQRGAEVLLLGEPFMAEAALEVGLVNRVVPPAECNALAQAQAHKLAAKPLSSVVAIKRLMKGDVQDAVQRRMDEENAEFARLLPLPAAREAMTAFMEKRKPDFSQC